MKHINGWWWPDNDQKSHQARVGEMLEDLEHTLTFVEDRGICLQAGGAIGIWPQFLAEHFADVYTFEPDPEQVECLEANVTAENVHKYNAAVGETPGFVGTVHNEERCNASYVDDRGDRVHRILLDSVSVKGRVNFMCLDLEGYELFALRGAEDILARDKPVVQVEDKHGGRFGIEEGGVDAFMQSLGYERMKTHKFDKVFV